MDIYGKYAASLTAIMNDVEDHIRSLNQQTVAAGQPKLYEHLIGRVKANDSMVEKCQRKGYSVSTESALRKCHDAIGIRIVCNFIDDIDRDLQLLRQADWCSVVKEKD
ncbi:gtp-pyrophosphokinase [Limosilactobacillus secaliphilus]|uniref:Gtp-pyrophosphokinase n=1 Tax=Limosilactobacillus secaliphilus TaxID=396268 RepID=A0A0R2I459_9LACO|nr:gtp-pyrophosphokinase [Limosilactobacillus secaliphilus]